MGKRGGVQQTYYKSVYRRLFLTDRNLATSIIVVKDEATIGAFRGMIYLCESV